MTTIEFDIQLFADGNSKTAVAKIPADVFVYNGHSYKLFDDEMMWTEAKIFCENLGGHLATITDRNEQALIEQILQNYQGKYFGFWLGAKKEAESFQWITGENFSYTNFATGHLDNSGNYLQIYGKPPEEYAYYYTLGSVGKLKVNNGSSE